MEKILRSFEPKRERGSTFAVRVGKEGIKSRCMSISVLPYQKQ